MTRRGFYQGAIFLMGGLIGAGIGIPAAAYLLLGPKEDQGEDGWADAGPLGSLPEGKPQRLIFERQRKDAWNLETEKVAVWALRKGDEVTAFSPKCPHLGCGVNWNGDSGQFDCPCHASSFSKAGEVLGGPAPRSLDRHKTRIEGDRLWLGPVQAEDEA